MGKVRSDSLYARLKPAQRDALCEWLLDEAISFEDAAARCAEEFGVQPSIGALHAFLKKHGFDFRLARAKSVAEDKSRALPKDWERKKAEALRQREFEIAFSEMQGPELVALRKLEIEERAMRLKEKVEPAKVELAARRIAILEENQARVKAQLEGLKNKGGVSPEALATIEETLKLL